MSVYPASASKLSAPNRPSSEPFAIAAVPIVSAHGLSAYGLSAHGLSAHGRSTLRK
jgi:hypothetical protein